MASKKSTARKAKATTWTAGEGEYTAKAANWTNPANFKSVEDFVQGSKSQLDKAAQDAANVSREAMETAMKSGNIFARWVEEASKMCMSVAQETTEKNSEAFKALLSCKTINELTETQNRLAQQNFDSMMSNVTRFSEMSIRAATDCFEPINDQFSKAMKKASDNMAA
ncbi:MAG: hypothetical protein GC136_04000 [Alphaproteobacteria bacterium]|nr:hypothetical protein [Alphaproteobacteria bacterium]